MPRKLDNNSLDAFEQTRVTTHKRIPIFKDFLDFIAERCKRLEATKLVKIKL